jgi:hypothetical protein
VWGVIAIAVIMVVTIARGRPAGDGWGRDLYLMYAGLCCGMPLGGLSGFAIAIQVAKDGMQDWSKIVWIAAALGAALGSALGFFGMEQGHAQLDVQHMLSAAVVAALMGTLCGIAAVLGEELWRRAGGRRIKPAMRVLGRLGAVAPAACVLWLSISIFLYQLTLLQSSFSVFLGVPFLCAGLLWLRVDLPPKNRKKALRRK